MGMLSKLFGLKREESARDHAFALIERIIENEEYQLEFVHSAMRPILESAPAYDEDPNGRGPFGYTETNPIPVNGPVGELAYLSRLETHSGQRILFHRIGAIDTVDVFEAVTFDGSEWFILFLDFYHPRRSRLTPSGFNFIRDVVQFSGFHRFCGNFPYDFVEQKHFERQSGLVWAYIPISKVCE